MKTRAKKIHSRFVDASEEYVKDPKKLQLLLDKISKFISKRGLRNVKDDLIILVNFVKDVATHRYTDYEMKNLLVIIGGLIYVIAPVDAIPDFIPIGGWLDDVFIVGWVIDCVNTELTKYKSQHIK